MSINDNDAHPANSSTHDQLSGQYVEGEGGNPQSSSNYYSSMNGSLTPSGLTLNGPLAVPASYSQNRPAQVMNNPHDVLLSYAYQLKNSGMDKSQLIVKLRDVNNQLFAPPFPEAELMTIIASVVGCAVGSSDKFDHAVFGDVLIEEHHMCFIDGAPAIWNGKQYLTGERAIFSKMIDLMHSVKKSQRSEIMSFLEYKAPKAEMADPRFIAFENGVLNIETGELMESSPDLIIPNIIPHKWNPDSVCAELDNALEAWSCSKPERRANLEETFGLCMYRGRKFGTCPILIGEGSNGKSTFLNLLHSILGEDNTSAMDASSIGERFQSTALMGKLANIGDDISNEFVSGSKLSVVKKVITGDWVSAEYKGGATFKFKPYCTLVFSCNEVPRLGDASKGMFRRFMPIPFEATFSKDDGNLNINLADILATEEACERMIYLGVKALKKCIERGSVTETEEQDEMLEDLRIQNSSVYQFACEELGFNTDSPQSIHLQPTGKLYDGYKNYFAGDSCRPVARNKFSTEMCKIYRATIKQKRIQYPNGKKQSRVFYVENECSDAHVCSVTQAAPIQQSTQLSL